MERLVCLALICVAAALADMPLDPRGARPVEHGTRDEKCATQREWPFCTDVEWGPKCPSGCRIQGLMDQYDHGLLKKIGKVRNLLDHNTVKHRNADETSKQTFDFLKDKLTLDAGNNGNYFNLAQDLRTRITTMKIKIDRQLRILAALKDRIKDQVVEMQRLEVDIDIKLRSCKGSCASYTEHQVDRESYVALDKQVDQLTNQVARESAGTLFVMKSRPLQEALVDDRFKSRDVPGEQRPDMFPDVGTQQLFNERDGSSSSPANIFKDAGTSLNPSTSSSSSSSTPSPSSSSSSSSTRSITELGGSDLFSSTHTMTSTCTTRTRTTIVHTKDGPVERTEEVVEGGPGCQILPAGALDFSSSSSALHTLGGTKGAAFGDLFAINGDDLGAFMIGNGEDDNPDLQARSVKTVRVERQADFIGQDCVEANKNHLKGESNGLFKIKPGGTDSTKVVEVYCQQEGLMGGWLLVQRRESGALGFNRTWAEYRDGFGSVDARGSGEFWLGNQNLHLLTNQGETMLKVELEDWEGGTASAEYTVRVGSEEEGYPLHVSGYTGEAGDALVTSQPSHNGMKFSTFDRDNDKWEGSCAETYGGGWWYNNCQSANLNGVYYRGRYDAANNRPYEVDNGVVWVTFKNANYSLKTLRMFIRSTAF